MVHTVSPESTKLLLNEMIHKSELWECSLGLHNWALKTGFSSLCVDTHAEEDLRLCVWPWFQWHASLSLGSHRDLLWVSCSWRTSWRMWSSLQASEASPSEKTPPLNMETYNGSSTQTAVLCSVRWLLNFYIIKNVYENKLNIFEGWVLCVGNSLSPS